MQPVKWHGLVRAEFRTNPHHSCCFLSSLNPVSKHRRTRDFVDEDQGKGGVKCHSLIYVLILNCSLLSLHFSLDNLASTRFENCDCVKLKSKTFSCVRIFRNWVNNHKSITILSSTFTKSSRTLCCSLKSYTRIIKVITFLTLTKPNLGKLFPILLFPITSKLHLKYASIFAYQQKYPVSRT